MRPVSREVFGGPVSPAATPSCPHLAQPTPQWARSEHLCGCQIHRLRGAAGLSSSTTCSRTDSRSVRSREFSYGRAGPPRFTELRSPASHLDADRQEVVGTIPLVGPDVTEEAASVPSYSSSGTPLQSSRESVGSHTSPAVESSRMS